MRLGRVLFVIIASSLEAVAPTRSFAQVTIPLEGHVISEDGSPLSDVQIDLTNVRTGERRRAATGSTGSFRTLGLTPGTYVVAAHAVGYVPARRSVELIIGQSAYVSITLESGAAELAPLEVDARRVPSLEIQRTGVSTAVQEMEIRHLPVSMRNALDLAALAPGIRSFRSIAGRGLPSAGAVRGERLANFYLDGVELKSSFDGNVFGSPQFGSPVPAGALKEFRVYLNPYDAQYARAAAYLITGVTHRGTNQREATAFGFFQNRQLVSSNDFLRELPSSTVRQADFRQHVGFDVRGPVQRDRLFYAASYELSNTSDRVAVVPRSPVFDAYAGTFETPDRNHAGVVRLTYTPSDESTFDLTWSARRQTNVSLFGGRFAHEAAADMRRAVQVVALQHRWLPSAEWLHEIGLHLLTWSERGSPLTPGPQLAYPSLVIGLDRTRFALDEQHVRLVNRLTRAIDGFYGAHLIRAGLEIERAELATLAPIFRSGQFEFANDTDPLPYRATIRVGQRDSQSDRDSRAALDGWLAGVYLSDEWRPLPRVTLNLGVRYDVEINTFNNDFTVPWTSDPELGSHPQLSGYLNRGNRGNDLDNFSPRVSMSWDVSGNGHTFLRGGYTVTHDRAPAFIALNEQRDANWRTYAFLNPGTVDPAVLRQRVLEGDTAARVSFSGISLDMEGPQSRQWSVGFGRQLTRSLSVNVDYVQQDVRNLFAQLNLNWVDAAGQRRVLSSNYGDIEVWDDFARARYHALLTQLAYQPRPDARVALAYTLGDAKADWDLANEAVPADAAHRYYSLQRTSGDERHRLVLSGVVSLPWSLTLSTITTLASPRPYRAMVGQDLNGNGFLNDDWINGLRYLTPANRWENWYRVIDVRVTRSLRFGDGVRGSLVVEAYNLLNTQNYSGYNGRQKMASGADNPSFRQPTGVLATRELQLGARIEF